MTETFRMLVDIAARRGIPKTEPPRTRAELAEECDISAQHLRQLMSGRSSSHGTSNEPPEWTMHKLVKGLKFSLKRITAALASSRKYAKV